MILLNSVNVYHMLVVWQNILAPLKITLLTHVESVTQRNPGVGVITNSWGRRGGPRPAPSEGRRVDSRAGKNQAKIPQIAEPPQLSQNSKVMLILYLLELFLPRRAAEMEPE